MGIFSSLFKPPADPVPQDVRKNSDLTDAYMKASHPKSIAIGDFIFEYLYTSNEPIDQAGTFGSVAYIRIGSDVHSNVFTLPADWKPLQVAIDEHQKAVLPLPAFISANKTRWLYFNMAKVFRTC